jgi:glycosyltransferase involved in cell wall biosynthesis
MLSVVIPTTNRPDSLIRLVASLQLQTLNAETCEILVVYNTENDKKLSPLPSSSCVKVLCAPKPGVNHARNHGALNAGGNIIVFLDDDCEVIDPHFLQKHIDYHQLYPQLVALGGPYLLSQTASVWDKVYHENNLNWMKANLTESGRTTALLGGNASYKAFVFADGYRFTEEIVYGGSETPLNTILALKYGAHGYFVNLPVIHNTKLTLWNLLRKAYKQGNGAALQTKMYGHQLRQVPNDSTPSSFAIRFGLELFALFFIFGYQAEFSKKKSPLALLNTLLDRYFRKKLIPLVQNQLTHFYWLQHSRIRHPLLTICNRVFWIAYSMVSKTYWFLRFLPTRVYWLLFSFIAPIFGFLRSLGEPLPITPTTAFTDKLRCRCLHVSKKFGWLFFKAVGLR